MTSSVSADGITWTARRNPFPTPAFGGDDIAVTDVVARGDGWLAVGRRDPVCRITAARRRPAYVWTSGDGSHWTRVADQTSLKGGGHGCRGSRAPGSLPPVSPPATPRSGRHPTGWRGRVSRTLRCSGHPRQLAIFPSWPPTSPRATASPWSSARHRARTRVRRARPRVARAHGRGYRPTVDVVEGSVAKATDGRCSTSPRPPRGFSRSGRQAVGAASAACGHRLTAVPGDATQRTRRQGIRTFCGRGVGHGPGRRRSRRPGHRRFGPAPGCGRSRTPH